MLTRRQVFLMVSVAIIATAIQYVENTAVADILADIGYLICVYGVVDADKTISDKYRF